MHRKINSYAEIIGIYNTNGKKEACSFIRSQYEVKNPYAVITKMKNLPEYRYDETNDKFITEYSDVENSVFMGLDELCDNNHHSSLKPSQQKAYSMEDLIRELVEERLLHISKYIHFKPSDRIVLVDQSSLVADGYEIVMH